MIAGRTGSDLKRLIVYVEGRPPAILTVCGYLFLLIFIRWYLHIVSGAHVPYALWKCHL